MMNKKVTPMLLLLLSIVLLLTGCASNKLSKDYDEDTVKTKAKEVVGLANVSDYEALISLFSEELQAQVTVESFESAWAAALTDLGAFSEFSKEVVLGQTIKESGEELAVAVIVADYENGKAQFTLTFNKDMDLIGAYMK